MKPFLPLELVTRVKALFRRVDAFSGQEEENSENLELGDIVLFPGRRTASLKGEEFALTPLESTSCAICWSIRSTPPAVMTY